MRKILNKRMIADIEAAKAKGLTTAEIAAKFHVSAGTIVNAGKAKSKTPALKSVAQVLPSTAPVVPSTGKPSEPSADAAEPPSSDEIRRYLGEAVRNLRDECTKAKASGDSTAFQSATRNMTAAAQLLGKFTPTDDPTERVGVYVTLADMSAAAAKCREKLTDLWEKAHAEKSC